MTQITGFIPPTRRPGALGIHSVDHFGLSVPDLEEARRFYTIFGLTVREEGNGLGLYTDGNAHCWGQLREGPRKKLAYVSFGAFVDDMPRFQAKLQELGVTRINPPRGEESNGIWFQDPWGMTLEIRVADKVSPNAKATVDNSSVGPNQRAVLSRSQTSVPRPNRFSHMLMFTPETQKAVGFYSAALGLRLADEAGGEVAFMHGIHGSDHHMLAFAQSDAPGIHHSSWAMDSTNAIGLAAMNMAEHGHSRGWGLGRHVLGSNWFHYVRDPWGSYAEYSAEIDYVPHDQDWDLGHWDPNDAFFLWGPKMPEDFVINYESAAA